jgi:hypothetical protein
MMGCRNRYFEGMEDGQMTPPRYPNFDSYLKNLCVLVFQTDGQTDRQTETLIRGGLGNYVPPGRACMECRGHSNILNSATVIF